MKRLFSPRALGFFAASLFDTGLFRQIVQCLLDLLKSKSVTQQMVSALVIAELASVCLQKVSGKLYWILILSSIKALTCPSDISDGLIAALNASCLFDEHTFMFSRLQTDGQVYMYIFQTSRSRTVKIFCRVCSPLFLRKELIYCHNFNQGRYREQ